MLRTARTVVVVALIGACGGDGGGSRPEGGPTTTSPPELSDRDAAVMVLLPDAEGVAALGRAYARESQATQRCIEAAGFSFEAVSEEDAVRNASLLVAPRQPDREVAASIGYGLRPGDGPTEDQNLVGLDDAERERYGRVAFGDDADRGTVESADGLVMGYPRDGCFAEGRAEAYGSVERWASVTTLPQGYRSAASEAFQEAPGFDALLEGWRACMAEQGLDVSSPVEAQTALQERYAAEDAEAVRPDEIRTAVADAGCWVDEGLVEGRVAAFEGYVDGLPADEQGRLADAWWVLVEAGG